MSQKEWNLDVPLTETKRNLTIAASSNFLDV
jgi:hypothetical protein